MSCADSWRFQTRESIVENGWYDRRWKIRGTGAWQWSLGIAFRAPRREELSNLMEGRSIKYYYPAHPIARRRQFVVRNHAWTAARRMVGGWHPYPREARWAQHFFRASFSPNFSAATTVADATPTSAQDMTAVGVWLLTAITSRSSLPRPARTFRIRSFRSGV